MGKTFATAHDGRLMPPRLEPELLRLPDGSLIDSPQAWKSRRGTLAESLVRIQFGGMPPAPESLSVEHLHSTFPSRRYHGATKHGYRIDCRWTDRAYAFSFHLFLPRGDGPFPVIVSGDGCWAYTTDEALNTILEKGFAYAEFDRCELAHDRNEHTRRGLLYDLHPQPPFGAIAAWAWGFHRVIDALVDIDAIDSGRIAVTGHSRSGKTALLAGATDTRIALTHSNGSGCGGAAAYRAYDDKGERLADLVDRFPNWFGPELPAFVDREPELPFDQHVLKALIAPRALLCTEAEGDHWASPCSSRLTHDTARPVWELHHSADRLAFHLRTGGHTMSSLDWQVLIDFATRVLRP